MTVGSRHWGQSGDGRGVIRIKLYEFAVYFDPNQMRRSSLANILRTEGVESLTANRRFYNQLRSNNEVDMSIVMKTSRSLPLDTMSMEYEKILKRRLVRVGGRTDDPSLPVFLDMFKLERLPAQVHDKQKNVKRGSVMCFKRNRDGTLTTYANDHKVGVVKSKALCSALFDLYLGDEPVSVDAKTLAGNRLIDMIINPDDKNSTITTTVPIYKSPELVQRKRQYSASFF
eukprot:g3662.t1